MKASPDFLVSKRVSTIELAYAGGYLLPEPSIVIDVAFNKLLHVRFRAAAVLRRHAFKFRLQFRGEVYFHSFGLRKNPPDVKRRIENTLPGQFQ